MVDELRITTAGELPADLESSCGGVCVRNFSFFAKYSRPSTELFWAIASDAQGAVGAAPVVRLGKRAATAMLRAPVRRWLGWLGPLARKTTLLVDTAFMAYDERTPFVCRANGDSLRIKGAIVAHLQTLRGVDAIWITEPESLAGWLMPLEFQQFYTLPMAQIGIEAYASMSEYVDNMSKKRRRNYRRELEQFEQAHAAIRFYDGPLGQHARIAGQMQACLEASAAHSQLEAPYNDVLTDASAFAHQDQFALAAEIDGQVIGFMSFLQEGTRLLQCHGGLDYDKSHQALAYHNLIYAAIKLGMERKCRRLSLGPLNNETKRRAATELRPMVASLWNRNLVDRRLAAAFFVRNFAVYQGDFRLPAAPR